MAHGDVDVRQPAVRGSAREAQVAEGDLSLRSLKAVNS
jgi:hypothetical protein